MTKKVKARRWSLEKFTKSVKDAATKAGVKINTKKIEQAYNAGQTVAFTVHQAAK